MEELHAAQRDLLANLENEMNHGSSTPPSIGAPAPQRINFIESDQIEQQSLPALVFPAFEYIPTKLPPSLFTPAGPSEAEKELKSELEMHRAIRAAQQRRKQHERNAHV